jgi:DNA (cytosine-5)-methyltransferase 1
LKVNVIDLFAGPGGLGEGFFSFKHKAEYPYSGICSVEMDDHAHKTLTLRAFYRKLIQSKLDFPEEYFEYANEKSDQPCNDETYSLWKEAQSETLNLELGRDEDKDIEIFERLKLQYKNQLKDKPTVLIGGPPCQAYSLVGRARNKGIKDYTPEADHRHFLYHEYLKIMHLFSPDIFVMENVKGMLSSQINGGLVFKQIINDLENCGDGYTLYSLKTGEKFEIGKTNPRDFLLKSEDYGIPQCRHRIIIIGIKNTLKNSPEKISSLENLEQVSAKEALENLPKVRSVFSNRSQYYRDNTYENWLSYISSGIIKLVEEETTLEPKIKKALLKNVKNLNKSKELCNVTNNNFIYDQVVTPYEKFVFDAGDNEILTHQPRPHMDTDLLRYFYCSTFRETMKRNARASDFPASLAPNHKSWNSGKFVDRFKVQSFETPSSTITSHISKDGHYFIHPDPLQCRSLTVKEAARLQTFPDSYVFMGKRTNQFHQVGNAVPPLLARQIATIVYDLIKSVY